MSSAGLLKSSVRFLGDGYGLWFLPKLASLLKSMLRNTRLLTWLCSRFQYALKQCWSARQCWVRFYALTMNSSWPKMCGNNGFLLFGCFVFYFFCEFYYWQYKTLYQAYVWYGRRRHRTAFYILRSGHSIHRRCILRTALLGCSLCIAQGLLHGKYRMQPMLHCWCLLLNLVVHIFSHINSSNLVSVIKRGGYAGSAPLI